MKSLETLYGIFARHAEGRWIMKPPNARALYEFVRKNDVRNVLELGTGIGLTAALVSLALTEKGGEFRIDTVEQSEKCHAIAKELVPEELRKNVIFHLSPVSAWYPKTIAHTPLSVFDSVPEGKYDLIIVDGPGPWLDADGRYVDLSNGDVLRMHEEGKISPGTRIFYDGRIKSLETIERHYGDNFWLLGERNRVLNVIERKDNEIKFEDQAKKAIGEIGYFA